MNGKITRSDNILIGIIMTCCTIGLFIYYKHYDYSPSKEMVWLMLLLFFGGIVMCLKNSINPEVRMKGFYSFILAIILWLFSGFVFVGMQECSDPKLIPPNMAVSFALINILIYNTIIVINGIFLLFAKRWAVKYYKLLLILWFPAFMVLGIEESYIKNSYHITICILLNVVLVLMGILYSRIKRKRKSLKERWQKWWNAPQITYDYDPEDQSTQNLANIAKGLAKKLPKKK